MKVKTAKLEGPALDWAVAKCEGVPYAVMHGYKGGVYKPITTPIFQPSTDWAQGGPIIDLEGITLKAPSEPARREQWAAVKSFIGSEREGPTPLIAAMRCFVASRLGDEVEVPDELMAQLETPDEPSPGDDQRPRARM